MTRVGVLRAGYAALALAFLALAASHYVAALVILGFGIAFLGGLLLAFSGDDIPRYGGLVVLAFFLLTVTVFVLANPISYGNSSGHYYIEPVAPDLAKALYDTSIAFSPIILAGAALAAAWERETPVRVLMVGGAIGLLIVQVVTSLPGSGQTQAALLSILFAVSALALCVGAGWSSARPEEYA